MARWRYGVRVVPTGAGCTRRVAGGHLNLPRRVGGHRDSHYGDGGFSRAGEPAATEFLIPLTLTFESGDDFEVNEIRYPPGEPYRLQGADEDLLVYGHTFAVPVSVRASATAHEGPVAVPGQLRYQACDDHLCLAPATLTFDLKARIVLRGDP